MGRQKAKLQSFFHKQLEKKVPGGYDLVIPGDVRHVMTYILNDVRRSYTATARIRNLITSIQSEEESMYDIDDNTNNNRLSENDILKRRISLVAFMRLNCLDGCSPEEKDIVKRFVLEIANKRKVDEHDDKKQQFVELEHAIQEVYNLSQEESIY